MTGWTPPTEVLGAYVPNFLIVLLRMSIFLSVAPFFSTKSIPAQFKIGFALAMAFVLAPVVDMRPAESDVVTLVVREAVFSIILGLSARFVFLVFESAGQMMSMGMGLSIAAVFNPEIGQSTEVSRLMGIVVMLLFLASDAHHELIYIFVKSYEIVPSGKADIGKLLPEAISLGSNFFILTLKIAAPVTVGMLVLNVLMGFLYKAAPQMNVFFVSVPLYILVGFLIMMLCLPVFARVSAAYFAGMRDEMQRLIGLAGS